MNKQKGFTSAELSFVIVCLLCIALAGGWVANLVKLAGGDFASITGLLVLRVIGIFVAPLGGVLGFF